MNVQTTLIRFVVFIPRVLKPENLLIVMSHKTKVYEGNLAEGNMLFWFRLAFG